MRLPRPHLALMLVVLLIGAGTASAQQPGKVYRIGWFWTGEKGLVEQPFETTTFRAAVVFRDALRDRGYVVGKNLLIDRRHADGDVKRLPAIAEALVASGVDLLVPAGTAPTAAAIGATKSIPIVFNGVGGPVEKGFVASLAKPGGNVTGMAVATTGPKLWQFLKEVAPATRRGAALVYGPNNFPPHSNPAFRAEFNARINAQAATVGLEPIVLAVDSLADIEARFAELGRDGAAGVIVLTDATLFEWRNSIVALALRHKVPTVCHQWMGWGEAGCLITYGEDDLDRQRVLATQVDKILKGTKPADIPVQQPTAFKVILNMKTAKALGLALSPSLLVQADEVIE
jgi:putative ABC transport system substrate-binding protein